MSSFACPQFVRSGLGRHRAVQARVCRRRVAQAAVGALVLPLLVAAPLPVAVASD